MKYVASIFLLVAVAVAQNPVVRTGTTGVVDLSSASATQPARKGTGAPSGPCIQGEQYFRTDAAAGQNLYFCSSADNWTQMAAGGGGNPVGATDPVSCTAGQLFFNTTEGLQKTCSASNIWTPLREVVSGAGIGVSNSGSTTSVSIDTAVILSQATAQQATPWVLMPTGNSSSAYSACPTPSLTAQPATGSPWILYPDVINEDNATLNICNQGALGLQIVLNGGLINVRAGDLRPSVPYVILKGPSTYIAMPLETADRDEDFTIAFIPDIQNMTEIYPSVLDQMMTWIKNNRFAWNIKAVVGGGDMTNGAAVPTMTTARSKWDIVKNSGDLVYVPYIGNHDYDNDSPSGRLTTIYDGQFGPSYFSGKSWYGASTYPASSNANYYVRFTAGSRKILILVMELFPRSAAVTWAQGVLNANLDHEVIVATHAYLNQNGTRILDGDTYGPNAYGIGADNSGEEMWNNLIKAYKNIRMVYCGHQIGLTKHARWSDVGTNGNIIHQMFTNYQDVGVNGGDGWLALLKFRPSKGTMEVHHYRTYAPSGLGYDPNFPSYSLPYEKVTPDASVIEANSPTTPFRSGTTPPARCAPKLEFFVDTDAATNKLLQCNAAGTGWDAVVGSGAGDMVGPASATDNALARFDSTTGKLIKDTPYLRYTEDATWRMLRLGNPANYSTIFRQAVSSTLFQFRRNDNADYGTVEMGTLRSKNASDQNLFTAGGGGVTVDGINMLVKEIAAPGAPGTANYHSLYFHNTDGLLKSHENGGSVVTYYSTVNPPPGTGYSVVQDEASPLTQRTTVNFTGAGVTCADDGVNTRTNCTISGGGAPAFSDITGATNTAAAMLVGTGASLGPTGSGTVTANQILVSAGAAPTADGAIGFDSTANSLKVGESGSTYTLWSVAAGAGLSASDSGAQRTVSVDTAVIPSFGLLAQNTWAYLAPSGGTDTYAYCPTPAIAGYTTGMVLLFKPDVNNTGAATFNLCSLGAKNLAKISSGAKTTTLANNDIDSDFLYLIRYDGTDFLFELAEGGGGPPANYWTSSSSTGIGPTSFTPTTTLHIKDATATTGVTQLRIEKGVNQGSTYTFIAVDSGGTNPILATDTQNNRVTTQTLLSTTGGFYFQDGAATMDLNGNVSTARFAFSPGAPSGTPPDVAFMRNASGVGAITSGTAGQYRDLKLRALESSGYTHANLPAANNGTLLYCSDCTIANPCASGGSGAFSKRLNGVWVCN